MLATDDDDVDSSVPLMPSRTVEGRDCSGCTLEGAAGENAFDPGEKARHTTIAAMSRNRGVMLGFVGLE